MIRPSSPSKVPRRQRARLVACAKDLGDAFEAMRDRINRHFPMPRALPSLLLVLSVAACGAAPIPSPTEMRREVEALAPVVRLMEEVRLAHWRNAESCRSLEVNGQWYASNLELPACSRRGAVPFDSGAHALWQRIADTVATAAVPIQEINAYDYEAAGLSHAEFGRTSPDVNRWAYIFHRNTRPLGPWEPNSELYYVEIEPGWYFEWQDWN